MTMLPIDAAGARRILVSLALLSTAPLISGCAETIIGVGATGAVAASQERGLGGAVEDTQIRTAINYLWLDENPEMYHQLNLNVQEGRVMITGVVPKQEMRDAAVRLAWRAKGVNEVIDEIIVDPKGTSGTYARDSWINAQLKTKLLFDKNVYSINYSIETVRGQVYILGVAQMDRAAPRQDQDRVEARVETRQRRMAREIEAGCALDAVALARADRLAGGTQLVARLHLDEGEDAPAARDDVDLAGGAAPVAGENAPAAQAQEDGRHGLGGAAVAPGAVARLRIARRAGLVGLRRPALAGRHGASSAVSASARA